MKGACLGDKCLHLSSEYIAYYFRFDFFLLLAYRSKRGVVASTNQPACQAIGLSFLMYIQPCWPHQFESPAVGGRPMARPYLLSHRWLLGMHEPEIHSGGQ